MLLFFKILSSSSLGLLALTGCASGTTETSASESFSTDVIADSERRNSALKKNHDPFACLTEKAKCDAEANSLYPRETETIDYNQKLRLYIKKKQSCSQISCRPEVFVPR